MLFERKELIEYELKRLYDRAATMYLEIVSKFGETQHSAQYQDLRDKISDFQHDLNVINQLIEDGNR